MPACGCSVLPAAHTDVYQLLVCVCWPSALRPWWSSSPLVPTGWRWLPHAGEWTRGRVETCRVMVVRLLGFTRTLRLMADQPLFGLHFFQAAP
jgi:hypothetical protein